ncbi:DUF5327 family protein [Staphylococcus kloosii]|uniref:DUF5327 family protein n=1 Tax=Staphylococcus kloosii TaxID=29384 RepID=UPI000D1F67D3|nr:DUF5327 family protein [Staphylococcus kloosii]MBF7022865.1 DUF5327 family protein [Staphylococcus kloosii]PTJ80579.1 hypothetical protein BUZ59_00360 [Staphylococcus kloosii]
MNKDNIIELIEHELVQADEAQSDADFEKHMYAIHTLTSLYANDTSNNRKTRDNTYNVASSFKKSVYNSNQSNSNKSTDISAEELQAMGAKVPSTMQQQSSVQNSTQGSKLTTDDNIGNGDSIFDF